MREIKALAALAVVRLLHGSRAKTESIDLNVCNGCNLRRHAIMAVKQLAFEADARASLLAGVEKLAQAVRATLGPRRAQCRHR